MIANRLLLLSCALLLSACAHHSRPFTIDNDSRCPLTLQRDQTLSLSLPSNPSTGYRWEVRDDASAVLHSQGPELYSADNAVGIVGAGGISTWRFVAHSAGQAQLQLVYVQPWLPDQEPAERFNCRIQVR